jgi:ABC-2 type transport system ATP-binding protein
MAAIRTRSLTKEFGDVVAVDDLDLVVEDGEVFGFLGPNGAGKSTTINLLLDFIRPTSGSVEVLGRDAGGEPAAIRERTGVLPEGYGFDDPLTGREYLDWAIETRDASDDPDEILELVGLTGDADRVAESYSKGMQQRLALSMALVDEPDLLILDEPTTGLDPNGIQQMRSVIRERAENGTTVFFSSHILSEVEAVCDRVGVMNEGKLVALDSIEQLRKNAGGEATIRLECASQPTGLGVDVLAGVASTTVDGDTLVVNCLDPAVKVDVVTHAAQRATITDITSETVSLESLFNDLTGGGRDSEEAAAGGQPSPDGQEAGQ